MFLESLSIFCSVYQVLEAHLDRMWKWYLACLIFLFGGVLFLSCSIASAPSNFPVNQAIYIQPGISVTGAAKVLLNSHVIRSRFAFRMLTIAIPGSMRVQSGVYTFSEPTNIYNIVWDVTHGVSTVPSVRVTFPEGTPVRTMGDQLKKSLPLFDVEHFKTIALPYEGYLFPDTYFFLPNTTPEEGLTRMRANFDAHSNWKHGVTLSKDDERRTVILASILEGEGKTLEDRRIIAGILLKRLSLNMPLQVDATFGYEYGRTGYVPTRADIEGNSAYNSYRMHGLPPTPINNPGEVSLLAAVTPTQTPYLFYLTGTDGQMHYARTFKEHIANQKKFFR